MALLHLRKRLTILYAEFNFFGFLLSRLKGIYNPCAIHTQVKKQVSVVRIFFAGLFAIISKSINQILLDAQVSEIKKSITDNKRIRYVTRQYKPNTYSYTKIT